MHSGIVLSAPQNEVEASELVSGELCCLSEVDTDGFLIKPERASGLWVGLGLCPY